MPMRHFIALASFESDLFAYTTSTEYENGGFVTSGSLDVLAAATSSNCPAGRIVRENGKKLYPGVNPGVSTLMIGVYDPITFLSGYISANSEVFSPVSTSDNNDAVSDGVDAVSGLSSRGPGMYTRGNLLVGGAVDISGDVVVSGQVRNGKAAKALPAVVLASTIIYTGNGPIFTQPTTGLASTVNVVCYSGVTGTAAPKNGETVFLKTSGTHSAASTLIFATNMLTTGPVAGNLSAMLSFVCVNGVMTEVARTVALDNA